MDRLKNIKGAVFDLDGTLLDSMHVWSEVDQIFFERRGMAVPSDYVAAIAPLGFPGAAAYTIERFGFKEKQEDIIKEWFELAGKAYAQDIQLKPGAKKYLESLKVNGVRLAAATASDQEIFLPCLERHGILSWFDTIITVHDVERGKGFPDIYEKAAVNMGLDVHSCAVFEDILKGITGAKAGGFLSVGVQDQHAAADEQKIRELADIYIESWEMLL